MKKKLFSQSKLKLLVFATYEEAEATLSKINATRIGTHLYRFREGLVAITGMGSHAAQQKVTALCMTHARFIELVWNFGFAAGLKETASIGDIVTVSSVGKTPLYAIRDSESFDIHRLATPFITLSQAKSSSLLTVDAPLHHAATRIRLSKSWDLCDMEGYGVAFASHALGKECKIWKIVSDFASGRESIKKWAQTLSLRLAQHVMENLYGDNKKENESCIHS